MKYELITDRNEQGERFATKRELRKAIKALPPKQWCEIFEDVRDGENFRILDRNLKDVSP